MLHRITGRAAKCGPAAISAIAGVPTHQAAAVIRRLFDRPTVNGVFVDELAAALEEFGWPPGSAVRHPNYRNRRFAKRESEWGRIFAGVLTDAGTITLGTFLDAAPSGTWAVYAGNHFVAFCDRQVADSGAWFARMPATWSRADHDHHRVALRRLQEAVRFVRVSGGGIPRNPRPKED